ncbi:hypothetical protein MMC25_000751 [Agyrium rufum]|nr:hypothetical protein [Agyrium rufum]
MASISAASQTSKVQVLYSDPSGLYKSIASNLQARLPLKYLHWNSPSRPLRSIDSLYVDLVADPKYAARGVNRPLSSGSETTSSASGDVDTKSENDGRPTPVPRKERRHQIPGLRQTPYLKVYFLKCDDTETYKTYSRKLIREWVAENTPPSTKSRSSSNQENHDAFEWMIIHVASIGGPTGTIWPNKAASSVLEKLRSDFNGSSKSSVDRVVQIPAPKSGPSQGSTTLSRVLDDAAADAWDDLESKLKSLILSSFDQRVRQYEEDIKEKSSQRNLPGWNFCTFFILREGLARGFENVGLVEDALVGYDELAIELQMAVRDEQERRLRGEDATLFNKATPELLGNDGVEGDRASMKLDKLQSLATSDVENDRTRELILANNISVFDFQAYVFARQLSLLSRLANILPVIQSSYQVQAQYTRDARNLPDEQTAEDLRRIAEICRRSLAYITTNGSTIREDLKHSLGISSTAAERETRSRFERVENMVASWTFTASQEILEMTAVPSLIKHLQTRYQKAPQSNGSPAVSSVSPGGSTVPAPPMFTITSNRNSSLITQSLAMAESPGIDAFGQPKRGPELGVMQDSLRFLAAHRAELLLVSRQALGGVGQRCGWQTGWAAFAGKSLDSEGAMDELSLSDEPESKTSSVSLPDVTEESRTSGLRDARLLEAFTEETKFYDYYEEITKSALELYQLSSNRRSAEAMMADIASLHFYQDDLELAAQYFHQLAPFYAEDGWHDIEIYTLSIYSRCLKQLQRKEEYARILLKLLAKLVQKTKSTLNAQYSTVGFNFSTEKVEIDDTATCLQDLLGVSQELSSPLQAPLERYFSDASLSPYLQHCSEHDGFEMELQICHNLSSVIRLDQISARLLNPNSSLGPEIWLKAEGVDVISGVSQITLRSKTMIPGTYRLERIILQCAKLVFIQEYPASADSSTSSVALFRIWPSIRSLRARACLYEDIHLEQSRSVVMELETGENAVEHAEVTAKGGSAGLRLLTSEAETIASDHTFELNPSTGALQFQTLPAKTKLRIRIPYRLETDMRSIVVRPEVQYTTKHGDFLYSNTFGLSAILPLGVNVQDIFKHEKLFSKFAISASTSVPLRLYSCKMNESRNFEVTTPIMGSQSVLVSRVQPCPMVYKIVPKVAKKGSKEEGHSKLSLLVTYQCLDEEITATFVQAFESFLLAGGLDQYKRLLTPYLESAIKSQLGSLPFERIGLIRQVQMPSFMDLQWNVVTAAIPAESRKEVIGAIEKWHKTNQFLPLPDLPTESNPHPSTPLLTRQIAIPVDIPTMPIVYTASLLLSPSPDAPPEPEDPVFSSSSSSTGPMYTIYQPIYATLTIKHTYRWSSSASSDTGERPPLQSSYTLHTPASTSNQKSSREPGGADEVVEDWLIGGVQHGSFNAAEDEKSVFEILLIPQRSGWLSYPGVDVQPLSGGGIEEEVAKMEENGAVVCEVDYEDASMTVFVGMGSEGRTFGLDDEEFC